VTYRLPVRVQPAASRTRVGGHRGGVLLVAVTAPAHDDRANEAARRALADAFHLRPHQVAIVRGHHARDKIVELDLDPAQAQPLLTALIGR
jgi:uncharacterized protein YggU (UPF0235/DUF167 family)